ncbi:MAG TPA: DUF5683 domain-containing protein [Chitinophagaceae bacterium]|nr:DUF5683 domain-containing protein [Chitinophagaceae bacterium]
MRRKSGLRCILLWVLFIFPCSLFAQTDDTTETDVPKALPNTPFPDSIFRFRTAMPIAKRAGLYSALLPGLGQAYNRQYWKIGLVAAATGVVTYFYIDNSKNYQEYQEAYINRLNNPTQADAYPERSLDDLDLLRKTFRKYKEYTVIAGTVCYLVNILDAFTSAHLKAFDMGKDISLQIAPSFNQQGQAGIHLQMGF